MSATLEVAAPAPAGQNVVDRLRAVVTSVVRRPGPDLTIRQLAILLLLDPRCGDISVDTLSVSLEIPKPSVSRACDRLRKEGYITRRENKVDRRLVVLKRTLKGEKFLAAVAAAGSAE